MNVTENPALLPPTAGTISGGVKDSATQTAADFDSFLTLLTAQLKNQDPLQPIDSTEFVAQLANFSTVEQLVGTNTRLDALHASGRATEIAALGSWIGREVATSDGSFRSSGTAEAFLVPRVSGADRVTARVVDPEGVTIDSFEVTPADADRAVWDGKAEDGSSSAGRDLQIVLEYRLGETILTEKPAAIFRKVVGIQGKEDGVVLELSDGRTVAAANLSRLRETAPETD